jgi:CBS-domain-containing membrane protein
MYFFIAYIIAMLSALHYGSNAIKNRITYLRTGYVEYRDRVTRWLPALAFSYGTLLSVGLYVAVIHHWEISASGAWFGLLVAAAYTRFAMEVRWKWAVSALMVAASFVISTLPADSLAMLVNNWNLPGVIPAKFMGAYWLTLVVFGALAVVSGGISFWIYLRRTRPPAGDAQ